MSPADNTGTARVFFALWPDDCGAKRLSALAGDLAARYGGRATQQETLHLTLVFVGNVSEERLPDLLKIGGEAAEELKALASARSESGFFQLDRLACWKQKMVLWAETDDCRSMPETLAGLLSENLRISGYAIPDRAFTPHVTLVRKLKTLPQAAQLDALKTTPLPWRARDFALLRSRTSRLGATYECLGSWKLATESEPDYGIVITPEDRPSRQQGSI